MKPIITVAIETASMPSCLIPRLLPVYSYPLTNNRRTGKAAERRKAKQRRRARL